MLRLHFGTFCEKTSGKPQDGFFLNGRLKMTFIPLSIAKVPFLVVLCLAWKELSKPLLLHCSCCCNFYLLEVLKLQLAIWLVHLGVTCRKLSLSTLEGFTYCCCNQLYFFLVISLCFFVIVTLSSLLLRTIGWASGRRRFLLSLGCETCTSSLTLSSLSLSSPEGLWIITAHLPFDL